MGLLDSKEKQRIILFRENRLIKRGSLPIFGKYVQDSKALMGWFRFREYLEPMRVFGKGTHFTLPIDERSAIPITPHEHHTTEELMKLVDADAIADEAEDLMSTQMESSKTKSRFQDMMGIAIMGMVFFLMLVVILFLSGRLKMGGA